MSGEPRSTPEPEQAPDITQDSFDDDTTTMSESKSARPVSKRVSTAPSAPKPPATIDPSAILANHATVTGMFPITVGANVVLNPYSKVLSNAGPVEIGEGCVIWERAVVGINVEAGARDEDDDAGLGGTFVMLERNCVIESGAQVSAKIVGEGTVIEAFASVGEGCVIGKVCFSSLSTDSSDLNSMISSSFVRSCRMQLCRPIPSSKTLQSCPV